MSSKYVCRTALATPGQLNNFTATKIHSIPALLNYYWTLTTAEVTVCLYNLTISTRCHSIVNHSHSLQTALHLHHSHYPQSDLEIP